MVTWKTVSVDLKRLCDVVDNDVFKKTKFKTLKTKVNKINKKILDATTLADINQSNTDKQNLEAKTKDFDKECLTLVV